MLDILKVPESVADSWAACQNCANSIEQETTFSFPLPISTEVAIFFCSGENDKLVPTKPRLSIDEILMQQTLTDNSCLDINRDMIRKCIEEIEKCGQNIWSEMNQLVLQMSLFFLNGPEFDRTTSLASRSRRKKELSLIIL